MAQRQKEDVARRPLCRRSALVMLGSLVLLAGCRTPPAHFADDQQGCLESRAAVLTGQMGVDTALEVSHHPFRATWQTLYGAADHVRASFQGEIAKRLCLPVETALANWCGTQPVCPGLESGLLTKLPLSPAEVKLHLDGPEALQALLQVIDQATCRIDVLMFEWEDDEVGNVVAQHLIARAGPNLRVRILVDGGGNLIFGRPRHATAGQINALMTRLAQHPYIELQRTRNPFGRFDHRKLVIVDGRLAWSGGRNLVRRVFCEQRDLSFTVAGPLAAELAEEFDNFWHDQGGAGEAPGFARVSCPEQVNAWAHLVHTLPGNHHLEKALYHAVDQASQRIYLENVYFCDSLLIYKLAKARRRGVDVRIVLTVTSTNWAINAANRKTANRLLAAGVRVYLFPGMTHLKAGLIDNSWGYIGTGNFDALSLRRNQEVGLIVGLGPLLVDLEQMLATAACSANELHEPLPTTCSDYLWEWFAGLCL